MPGVLSCGEAAREKWQFSSGEKWHLLRKIKEKIFLPHPTTAGTGPLQTIPHPRARRARLVPGLPGEGMETGQTEPCINSLLANPASEQELSLKSRNTSLIEFDHIFIFCLSEVNNETIIPRVVRLCIARAVTKACAPGISLGYYEHVPWLLS